MNHRLPLSLLFFTVIVVIAHGETASYTIGAQYRGMVKKAFPEIGHAQLQSTGGPGGTFRMCGTAQVKDPQDSKTCSIGIDMGFRLRGADLQCLWARNSFGSGSEKLRGTLEDALPLVHLVRVLPRNAPAQQLRTQHGAVSLSYRAAGRTVEVTAKNGANVLAKFFLSSDVDQLDKFRIPIGGNVTLNFASGSAARAE